MRRDPLIIGAGPAGTAAAITLGRAGHQPILLEKTNGPSDKVCGDFVSQDAIQLAQSLGVDPAALGAAPIHRVRVVAGGRIVESALPFAAVGLSRRIFDAALLQRAREAGAIVHAGQTVRRLTHDGEHWTAQTDTGWTAETVFLATGKHDLRDSPRPRTRHDAIGLKTYLELAPGPAKVLAGVTELTLFPGGYAGMQFVEHGRVVLCVAVRRGAFRLYGASWSGVLAAIQRRSNHFAAMIDGARALLARPLAVAGVPYGYQADPSALFRVGDQAAVIPSLTGDGVAIALHSGRQAAGAWLDGGEGFGYQSSLADELAPQMRLAGLLQRAGTSSLGHRAAVAALRVFPGVLGWAAGRTRLGVVGGGGAPIPCPGSERCPRSRARSPGRAGP